MGKKKRKKCKRLTDVSSYFIHSPSHSEVWFSGWHDVLNLTVDRKTVEIGGAEFVVINAGENEDLT